MTATTDLPAICELARYSQWVCWRKEQRDGKPTKVPYNARTGELASSTSPDTWSTFEQATAAAFRYDGIGFVLTAEDPYTGVDLDHCIEHGVVAPWAMTIISTLNSYCEMTPSGAGLRLFVRGKLPPGGRKRGNIEMYETGRYLTVTGDHWPGTPATIEERGDTLGALHPRIFTEPTTNGGPPAPTEPVDLEDDELLRRARAARNSQRFEALWCGHWHSAGYPSQSEGDMALALMLAFWTGRDAARIDRLFRASGLFRPKWDRPHFQGGETYGQHTIRRAIENCVDTYSPRREGEADPVSAEPAELREPAGLGLAPWKLFDAADKWGFPPVEFIVESLLPAAGVVWLGGLPKRRKSLFMLYLCLAIAAEREKIAEHFAILRRPKILYVAREDPGSRLQDRRGDILSAWDSSPRAQACRFVIRPHLDLLIEQHVRWLRETCAAEDITVLVLDTWTALSPGADPLGAKDQATLAAVMVQLAQDIGGVVVVLDHSRKNRPEGQSLSAADIFGPLQKWAAAEHVLMLDETSDAQRIEVFIEGKDGETYRFFLDVSPRGSGDEKFTYAGSVQEIAESQRQKGDENREAVFNAVARAGARVSADEVVSALAATGRKLVKDTVQRHLTALVEAGRLARTGKTKNTRYEVADSGQQPSSENHVRESATLYE